MDTTDFKRDDLPPLPPDEAVRRREAFFKAGGANLCMLMQFAETLPETGGKNTLLSRSEFNIRFLF